MEIVKKDFGEKSFYDYIFERLRGTVFHLTRLSSFESIKVDKLIHNNQKKKYHVNTGSKGSYGRKRGYVCLFDFRRSDGIIKEKLEGYDGTLAPHWFEERTDLKGGKYRVDLNVAYLILASKYYGELKLAEEAKKEYEETDEFEQKISEIECWFTRNLPLEYVEKVYLMKSYRINSNKSDYLSNVIERVHRERMSKGEIDFE